MSSMAAWPCPKSADNQRQRENLDVFGFALTQQQMAAIDALETGAPPRLDSDYLLPLRKH